MPNFIARSNVTVNPVRFIAGNLVLFYTSGLHESGYPELLMLDVPTDKIQTAGTIMATLIDVSKEGKVHHGYKMEKDGYYVVALKVSSPYEHQRLVTCMQACNPNASIVLLKPIWDIWEPITEAPEGKKEMQESILSKWTAQSSSIGFIRFLDSDKTNCRVANLLRVSSYDALVKHRSSTDWDCDLTSEEAIYAQKHWNHFVRVGLAEIAKFPEIAAERYIATVAENIYDVQSHYNHGVKLAEGAFSWDLNGEDTAAPLPIVNRKCDKCGKSEEEKSGNLKACGNCMKVVYCSIECQKAHWKEHKPSCIEK